MYRIVIRYIFAYTFLIRIIQYNPGVAYTSFSINTFEVSVEINITNLTVFSVAFRSDNYLHTYFNTNNSIQSWRCIHVIFNQYFRSFGWDKYYQFNCFSIALLSYIYWYIYFNMNSSITFLALHTHHFQSIRSKLRLR